MSDDTDRRENPRQEPAECIVAHNEMWKDIRKYVGKSICTALKPTKAKQVMMWGLIIALISGASGFSWKMFAMANETLERVMVKAITDQKQTSDLEHLQEKYNDMKEDHKDLTDVTNELGKTLVDLRILMSEQNAVLEQLKNGGP